MTDNDRKPPLWPLFLLATALGVFGFAMAFGADVESEPVLAVETPPQSQVGSLSADGISPAFIVQEQSAEVWLTQTVRSGETKTDTKVSFTIQDSVSDGTVRRDLADARVELFPENDRAEFEVGRLIDTLKFDLEFGPNAELKKQSVASAEAGQLARVVESIESANWLLAPNYPGGLISPGKKWTAQRTVKAAGENVKFSGPLTVERQLVGVDDRGAWIKQTVRQSVLSSKESKPGARVSGVGTALVSPETGIVIESRMTVQTTFVDSKTVFTSEWVWLKK